MSLFFSVNSGGWTVIHASIQECRFTKTLEMYWKSDYVFLAYRGKGFVWACISQQKKKTSSRTNIIVLYSMCAFMNYFSFYKTLVVQLGLKCCSSWHNSTCRFEKVSDDRCHTLCTSPLSLRSRVTLYWFQSRTPSHGLVMLRFLNQDHKSWSSVQIPLLEFIILPLSSLQLYLVRPLHLNAVIDNYNARYVC